MTGKKVYTSPKIKVMGNVTSLTQGGGGSNFDIAVLADDLGASPSSGIPNPNFKHQEGLK